MNSKDIKNLSKLTEALRGRESHSEPETAVSLSVGEEDQMYVTDEIPSKYIKSIHWVTDYGFINISDEIIQDIFDIFVYDDIGIDPNLNTSDIVSELTSEIRKAFTEDQLIYVVGWAIGHGSFLTFSSKPFRSILHLKIS